MTLDELIELRVEQIEERYFQQEAFNDAFNRPYAFFGSKRREAYALYELRELAAKCGFNPLTGQYIIPDGPPLTYGEHYRLASDVPFEPHPNDWTISVGEAT